MLVAGSYNIYIVILSIVIAVLSSLSALNSVAKISDAKGKTKYFWLISGAIVMGSGIWSMHFLGMLAFNLHAKMTYDLMLTILSMVSSMLSSFVAFYITMPKKISMGRLAFGGFIMGSGITAMHYIGMEAMIMPMEITYDKGLVFLSIVIAFIASYAALFLFIRFKNNPNSVWLKWLSAIVMGVAICGMHYVGMKAALFHNHSNVIEYAHGVDMFLLYSVSIITLLILFTSWGTMFFDRHVLEKMAYEDTITGLANRNEMNNFFDTYRSQGTIGVLYIDLDKFKMVNDTIGHDMGDLLIREVGNRLSRLIGKNQQAYRIGGDEFLLIATQCDEEKVIQLAELILQTLKKVYTVEGNELYITASIGISLGTINDSTRFTLLKKADTAMYEAKVLGKNRFCMYTDAMGAQEERKMRLEKDLHVAMENDQFYIVYQPKWNVKTDHLHGFEALLRWEHPQLGLIHPMEFIPITEETGLIVPITEWLFESVSRQIKTWQSQWKIQPVSVNLSIRLFQTGNLTEMVQHTLEREGLEPHLLELEVTESMIFYDIEDISQQLQTIRSLGVRVSMDDFGTGYSSLGLLDRIPIDTLKLDRLFITNLETPGKRAIIKAIISMAESLELDVIAEGVENEEHIEILTELGCYLMQGYFYGKPMKVEEIDECYFGRHQNK